MNARPVNILLVEDNSDHVLLIKVALEENNKSRIIYVVNDGMAALDFLYNRNRYEDKTVFPCPDLILLDIKLPKMSGLEVLERIKSDPQLKHIPIIIISSSLRQSDIATAYTAGVNSYLSKPINYNDFTDKIKQLKVYWLKTNVLPTLTADLE